MLKLRTAVALIGLLLLVGLMPAQVGLTQGSGYEIWTANQANDLVAIIQPETWQVVATVDVNSGGYNKGAKPHMLTISPSGRFAYIANVGAAANTNNVTIIRTADRKIVAQMPTVASAHAAIPSHDGGRVWVYNTAVNRITEILADETAEKWTVARTLELGIRPICGMFTPDNRFNYVTLGGNADNLGGIAIIDVASGTVVRRIEAGRDGCGTVLSRDRSRMYVNVGWHARNPAEMNDVWWAFNPTNHSVIRSGRLQGVKDSHGLGETPDGKELWIVNRQSNTLTILDSATGGVKEIVGTADRPDIVDFSPDGKYAFWTLRGEPQTGDPHALRGTAPGIEVFDVAGRKSVAIIPIAGDPHGIVVRRLSATAAPAGPIPSALPTTGAAAGLIGAGALLAAGVLLTLGGLLGRSRRRGA